MPLSLNYDLLVLLLDIIYKKVIFFADVIFIHLFEALEEWLYILLTWLDIITQEFVININFIWSLFLILPYYNTMAGASLLNLIPIEFCVVFLYLLDITWWSFNRVPALTLFLGFGYGFIYLLIFNSYR